MASGLGPRREPWAAEPMGCPSRSAGTRCFALIKAHRAAKLCRAANRDADAHAVLAPAVEGFPPTQHFPELAEAQPFLAALSP
jgi:hypothetical protein